MQQGQTREESYIPPQHAPFGQAHEAEFAPGQWKDPRAQLHGGVEKFMAGVYGWMAAAVLVTAGVVAMISQSAAALKFLYGINVYTQTMEPTAMRWVVLLAPVGFVMLLGNKMLRMGPAAGQAMLIIYAALIGGMLGYIPLVYDGGSIAGIFLVSAGMFAAMSAFGYFTKKDLTGLGQFLSMAVIGLIIAWVVSFIFPEVYFAMAAVGVLIFAGLTAYDTQNIKQIYMTQGGRGNLAIIGALQLYISLVNIFIFLLHLFGSRD